MIGGLLSPEERKFAFYQGLLSAGPALMAAGAPSTTPGGNIQALQGVGQGLLGAQQNAAMQKMQGVQMEDYLRQREQEDAFRASLQQYGGILSPDQIAFLENAPTDVGMGLLGEQLFAGQGEGFTLGAGDVRYDANGNIIAQGPAEPPAAPTIRDFTVGNQIVTRQLNADGTWSDLSTAPRWQTPQPPAAPVVDSASDLVEVVGDDGVTRLVPAWEAAGMAVPTPTPERAAPPSGYEYAEDGVSLRPIAGGPADPETLSPTDRRKYDDGLATLGRTKDAVSTYAAMLLGENWNDPNVGPTELNTARFPGRTQAQMETAYFNALLELKTAYDLGVLNGPDLDLMTSILTDPTSLWSGGMFMGPEGYKEQIDQIMAKLGQIEGRWNEQYGMGSAPAPATGGLNDPAGIM